MDVARKIIEKHQDYTYKDKKKKLSNFMQEKRGTYLSSPEPGSRSEKPGGGTSASPSSIGTSQSPATLGCKREQEAPRRLLGA